MTRQEWDRMAAHMQAYWKNRILEDDVLDAWFMDLEDIDAERAFVSLRSLAREGREWPPNGGEIRAHSFSRTVTDILEVKRAGEIAERVDIHPDAVLPIIKRMRFGRTEVTDEKVVEWHETGTFMELTP